MIRNVAAKLKTRRSMYFGATVCVIILAGVLFVIVRGVSGNEDLAGQIGVVFMLLGGWAVMKVLNMRPREKIIGTETKNEKDDLQKKLKEWLEIHDYLLSDQGRIKYGDDVIREAMAHVKIGIHELRDRLKSIGAHDASVKRQ
ncbi:MAG TPA: hypothetical protein PK846_19395 [Spirochaetota bacterium]|nr:hypothetical protein [Spirochaetota bacterium]